ncbi:MAG TPA: phosphomannomutase/phosphoglucomutase [Candidatus Tenderia sp.]|nr:phosphomannomutase/phosphoglucomutase [Candidatus Tenderia sp.]
MAFDESYADLIYQDKEALSVSDEPAPRHSEPDQAQSLSDEPVRQGGGSVSRSIFRAYDIRGVVDETLTPEVAHQIGLAIGSEAWVRGEQSVVVGRDGRLSGPKLCEALIQGIRDSGRDVIDIGRVPTPVLYFATHYLSTRSGVMVTGSHNPSQYNGFKIVLKGEALSGGAIKSLYSRIANKDFTMGEGTLTSQDIQSDYIARVIADVSVKRPLRVVVDCGNGVAGEVAPTVLRGLGCDVIELHCEVDGHFPNHHPDPSQPENLIELVEAVREHCADIGLAFDGDGDRLGVVDSDGNIIWPDRQLMLFARDVLKHHPGGQVIYDVKCSRYLQSDIEEHGGVALMWKSGHSLMRGKLQEMQGVLAGEMSGHIFFNDRWYGFDDGIYTAARLIEIVSAGQHSSAQIFASLPHAISTPELRIELPEGKSVELMKRLQDRAHFNGAELIHIDGIRAEFDGGWGLVRASNTTPALTLRFEADDEEWLAHIQSVFKEELQALAPNLALPI